jgi:hypothetical protein
MVTPARWVSKRRIEMYDAPAGNRARPKIQKCRLSRRFEGRLVSQRVLRSGIGLPGVDATSRATLLTYLADGCYSIAALFPLHRLRRCLTSLKSMSARSRHRCPDRSQGRRVQRPSGPTPLGHRAHHFLVDRRSPPQHPLRPKSHPLPGLPHPGRSTDRLHETHEGASEIIHMRHGLRVMAF